MAAATQGQHQHHQPQAGGDRLYSAEQIVVPDGLPDILKLYSKAVIRAQPSDLLKFSFDYFCQQAGIELSLDDTGDNTDSAAVNDAEGMSRRSAVDADGNTADGSTGDADSQGAEDVTLDQLRALLERVQAREETKTEQVLADCADLAIPSDVVEDVLGLGGYENGAAIDTDEFLVLCLALIAEDIQGVSESIFQLFAGQNGSLPCDRFLALFGHVASKDEAISEDFVAELTSYLTEEGGPSGDATVSYAALSQCPLLQDLDGSSKGR